MNIKTLFGIAALTLASTAVVLVGCGDDEGETNNGNPFNPGGTSGTSGSSGTTGGTSGGTSGTAGDCTKPEGCFCGVPATQDDWLNRCTTAAALPVNLTVKTATVADVP